MVQLLGLFSGISLLEHACVPSVMLVPWAVDEFGDHSAGLRGDQQHVVVACRDIARGEHLSLDYYGLDWVPTCLRREVLADRRGFYCVCALCADPTEAGLFMHSWCCATCKGE